MQLSLFGIADEKDDSFWVNCYKAFSSFMSYIDGGFPEPTVMKWFNDISGVELEDKWDKTSGEWTYKVRYKNG